MFTRAHVMHTHTNMDTHTCTHLYMHTHSVHIISTTKTELETWHAPLRRTCARACVHTHARADPIRSNRTGIPASTNGGPGMANVLRYVNDVRPKVDAIMMSAYALARVRIDWPAQSGLDGPARGACVPPCAVSAELSPLWASSSPAQSFCHELILFCSFFFFLRQLCSRSAAGLRQL